MRPLKSNKRINKSTRNKSKLESAKSGLNFFQNKKLLIEIWHFLFFSSSSVFLFLIFSDQAWRPISFEQTKISGLSGITRDHIKKHTSIFYPKNLLELNPKEIESYLIQKLPINEIKVSRSFFPPEINIKILEKKPISFAIRDLSNNIEKGMIDINGSWIPLQFVNPDKQDEITLLVENWDPNKKNEILSILKNRFFLQSPIRKIKINPLNEISLETEHFNSVLLGNNTDRLNEQINKLNQLQKSLPNLLINTKVRVIDLRDPSKTELKIEKILSRDQ